MSNAGGGQDSGGFLDLARSRLSGYFTHATTEQAVANLIQAGSVWRRQRVNLLGHGWSGDTESGISTGQGSGSTASKHTYISNDNICEEFARLRGNSQGISEVVLWGCNVGARAGGAALVTAIAKMTNAVCWAPTGTAFTTPCGEMAVQVGQDRSEEHAWQWCRPGDAEPAPKDPPDSHFEIALGDWTLLVDGTTIPLSTIQRIDFFLDGIPSFSIREIARVRPFVDFGTPLIFEGAIGGRKTGTFVVVVRRAGVVFSLQFTVINDALVQDPMRPSFYYPCKSDFRHSIVALLD
ncbi:MAG TPA: hypothetical protein VFL07_03600 [Rudaea sp.]|nr:hypothetical protein [Rudaea sp.]